MAMHALVTTMTDLPHGRRWMTNPELGRVYVSAELPESEQWQAAAEGIADMLSTGGAE